MNYFSVAFLAHLGPFGLLFIWFVKVCLVPFDPLWSIRSTLAHSICKVEFNQPSCWLYSVSNLLVIQYLENLYLDGNQVRVVCERVWRKAQECILKKSLATGSCRWLAAASRQMLNTCQACQKLKRHASWSTTRQKVQTSHSVTSRLELATQSSHESKLPVSSILKKPNSSHSILILV